MTAKIKLNAASGGGSVSLQAPSSSSNNRVISLPDIADGTLLTSQSSLDSTKLSPAISSGISMIDTYNLSSSVNMSGATWNYLKTNFSRVNGAYGTMNVTGLGTGLSVSNAGSASTFSFPSTGYYEITFTATTAATTSTSHDYVYTAIHIAKDGSTFDNTVQSISFIYSSSATVYQTQIAKVILDVTNTSNDKFYLAVMPENNSQLLGSNDKFYTYLQVKKIAET